VDLDDTLIALSPLAQWLLIPPLALWLAHNDLARAVRFYFLDQAPIKQ
jgi:hypothetical protein